MHWDLGHFTGAGGATEVLCSLGNAGAAVPAGAAAPVSAFIPVPSEKGENTMAGENGKSHEYDYDLVVIGGGSGGLSASKEAAKLGAKVSELSLGSPFQ